MTKVFHKTFGQGSVISETNGNVTVDFNGVEKTLIVKFAGLKNEDGSDYGVVFVAPEKKVKKTNYMSNEDYAKTKTARMSDEEWEAHRNFKKWGSKSW
jgi:hypothetical protein